MIEEPKRGRGRPKMTDAEKAAAKAARDAAKVAESPVAHLSDDEHKSLMQQRAAEIGDAEVAYAEANSRLKDARARAKKVLGKDALDEIKLFRQLSDPAAQEKMKGDLYMRARIARWAGMEVGHMDDLFIAPRPENSHASA